MISRLRGELLTHEAGVIEVITSGGVGYEVIVSASSVDKVPEIGSEINLFTHLVIREDEHLLFGFLNVMEKEVFKRFISISGVGPKMALAFLSIGVNELVVAIKSENLRILTAINGVGKKTAERILLELKGKLDDLDIKESVKMSKPDGEALKALIALGVNALEANKAVWQVLHNSANKESLNSAEIIKEALVVLKS